MTSTPIRSSEERATRIGGFKARCAASEFVASLRARHGENCVAALGDAALVVVKPDGIVTGMLAPLIAQLEQRDIYVAAAWIFADPEARRFEELYKFNLSTMNEQNMLASWWLNRKVYTFAPSVALVVVPRGEGSGLYPALAALKGPSNPYLCEPWQLRRRLGACNRAVNILHVADDCVSTAREILALSSPENLDAVLGGLGDRHRAAVLESAASRVAAIATGLPAVRVEVDFASLLWRLRTRWHVAHGANVALLKYCEEVAVQLNAGGDIAARRDALTHAILTEEQRFGVRDVALFQLLENARKDRLAGQHVVKELRAAEIHVDDWEEVIVETSAYYRADLDVGAVSTHASETRGSPRFATTPQPASET